MSWQKPPLGSQIIRRDPSLVGCWLMNEGAGNTLYDLSGNHGPKGVFGTADWVVGCMGYGVYHNDPSDRIILGTDSALKFRGEEPAGITVAGWINVGSVASYDCIVSGGKWTDAWALMFYNNTSQLRFYSYANAQTSSVALPTGEAAHFAVTTSNGQLQRYYINGRLVDTEVGGSTWEMDDQPACIGAVYSAGTPTYALSNSTLYNLAIYDRALTPAEIASLYRDPYWMFRKQRPALWSPATQGGGAEAAAGYMTLNTGYWG